MYAFRWFTCGGLTVMSFWLLKNGDTVGVAITVTLLVATLAVQAYGNRDY